jgi:hypothetical protein
MNTLPYKVAAVSDGAGGFEPLIFDKSNLGFSPADTFSSVQISCSGLDGGLFEVLFKPRNAPDFISFIALATEGDSVLLENRFVFDAVKIVLSDCGAGAEPFVFPTFIKRSF